MHTLYVYVIYRLVMCRSCTKVYTIGTDCKLTDILVKMYNRRDTTESHILSLLPPKRRQMYSGKVQIYQKRNIFITLNCYTLLKIGPSTRQSSGRYSVESRRVHSQLLKIFLGFLLSCDDDRITELRVETTTKLLMPSLGLALQQLTCHEAPRFT